MGSQLEQQARIPGMSRERGFLGMGLGSGLLGGVCCVGSAVAVGAGVAGLSFFTTWMERYQVLFIGLSLLVMVVWLARLVHVHRGSGRGLKVVVRSLGRQVLVMGAVYVVTLGVSVGASMFVVEMT